MNRKFNNSAEAGGVLGSVESDETITKKLKEMDIESFHFELIKSYKLNALMMMVELKDHYLICLKNSVNNHLRALVIILKELEPYNEFCLSIKRRFKFLYERNNKNKSIINNCQTEVLNTLLKSYFFFDLSEYGRRLESNVVTFLDIFEEMNTLKRCIDEIYFKYTSPFDTYIEETTMYKKFIQSLTEGSSGVSGTESKEKRIDMFLKTFTNSINQMQVNQFFQELFKSYTDTTHSNCFTRT